MGYFPNATAWECWAADNCFKCGHWPKGDDAPMCPVEVAHMLFNYELCNDTESPGARMLDMLIPRTKGDLGNEKCAMLTPRNGVTEKHLRDWEKYKAIMAEAAQGTPTRRAETTGSVGEADGGPVPERDAPEPYVASPNPTTKGESK